MKRNREEVKDIFVKVKVTEAERQAIRDAADSMDISISDMIRLGVNTIGGTKLEYGYKKRKT